MIRLIVFLSVLLTFILILVLHSYRDLPIDHTRFDFKKTQSKYLAHENLIKEITAPKEQVAEEEAVEVDYAPVVELKTPQQAAGQKLFNQCISCHGKGGEGKLSQKAPHIGGQYDWYIEKQLLDMKSGARVNAPMVPIVKPLSAEDIKALAAYVTLLPWNKEKYLAEQQKQKEKAKK